MKRDISPERFFCRNTLSSSAKDPIQDLIQICSRDLAEIQTPKQKNRWPPDFLAYDIQMIIKRQSAGMVVRKFWYEP